MQLQSILSVSKGKWNLGFNLGLVVLFFTLLSQGPILQPDSAGYIGFSPLRSLLYPLLLKFNAIIAGADNFNGLIFFQLLLGFYSAIQLSEKLRTLFSLGNFSKCLFVVALLPPYYYGEGKFGNCILTEALAYPLFLLAVGFLLEGLLQKRTRSLLYCLGFTALVILTRRQFLFIYPVFALCLVYLFVRERKNFNIGLLTLAFVGSIFATNFVEKTYQYIRGGQFSTIPFTGIQLIIGPLYIAKDSDAQFFQDEQERKLFLDIRARMHEKGVSFEDVNKTPFDGSPTMTLTQFYENYYNTICWKIVSPALARHGYSDLYQIDKVTTKMAFTLIKHNVKTAIHFYLRNIIYNMGGLYFSFLLICGFLIAFVHLLQSRSDLSLMMLVILLLSAGNYSLIVLVEPILRRYAVYTDTLQLCMLLALVMIALRKKA